MLEVALHAVLGKDLDHEIHGHARQRGRPA